MPTVLPLSITVVFAPPPKSVPSSLTPSQLMARKPLVRGAAGGLAPLLTPPMAASKAFNAVSDGLLKAPSTATGNVTEVMVTLPANRQRSSKLSSCSRFFSRGLRCEVFLDDGRRNRRDRERNMQESPSGWGSGSAQGSPNR